MEEIKLTRTLHNQLIIGKTQETEDYVVITTPYNVMPDMNGLNLSPMDYEIVGNKIEEIKLYKQNLMYTITPNKEVVQSYLTSISGIETEKKQNIIV